MKFLHRLKLFRFYADNAILLAASLLLMLYIWAEVTIRIKIIAEPRTALLRTFLLVLICLQFYLGTLLRRKRLPESTLPKRIFILFFFLYLYLIITFTLLDESFGRGGNSVYNQNEADMRAYYLKLFVNFKPFHSIYQVYIKGFINGYVNSFYTLLNLLGNLCAFMPFAFFLPLFFKAERKWYVFLPSVLLIVAGIEALQFFLMVGSCDVDDLILNAGGAFALFWILKIPKVHSLCKKLTFTEY